MLNKEEKKKLLLIWAKGTIAAGFQRAGKKNYNQAVKYLKKNDIKEYNKSRDLGIIK